MVGPFMQGVLLMGIIYWYTKGMLSLINDYYRTEIQRKIIANEPLNESSDFIGVDQIVQHRLSKIKNESVEKDKAVQWQQIKEIDKTVTTNMGRDAAADISSSNKARGDEIDVLVPTNVCMHENRLEEFYKLVEQTINRICLVD